MSAAEIAHHGITVTDIDRTAKFFEEVIGLTAGERRDHDADFSEGMTGVPGARISTRLLYGLEVEIELVQYNEPANRLRELPRPCDTGSAHLALIVPAVKDVVAAAARYGWEVRGTIQTIPAGTRKGGSGAYLQDPGGGVLEVVQGPG